MSDGFIRYALRRTGFVLLASALLIPVTKGVSAEAQFPAAAIQATYRAAEDRYYDAMFEQAVELLGQYLARQDLIKAERIDGLKLLGSCRVALGEDEKARDAIQQILDLEPDYLIDPDTVPPGLLQVYFRVLADSGKLEIRRTIRSVAILDLTNTSITDHDNMDPLRQGLADALITCVGADTCPVVVERERLEFLRKEIGLQQTSEFDQGTAVRVGKLIAAHHLLMGGFTRIGNKIRIDVRLVKTETGQVVKTHSVEGRVDQIFDLMEKVGTPIVEYICGLPPSKPTPQEANFQALVAYSQGLTWLDRGDVDEAYKSFKGALAVSPDFEKARRRIRQLAPLLVERQPDEK